MLPLGPRVVDNTEGEAHSASGRLFSAICLMPPEHERAAEKEIAVALTVEPSLRWWMCYGNTLVGGVGEEPLEIVS